MSQESAGAWDTKPSATWSDREFRFDVGQQVMHILQNHIEGGNQQQSDAGRKQDTEAETDGHGYEELRLEAPLQEHRSQPCKGR